VSERRREKERTGSDDGKRLARDEVRSETRDKSRQVETSQEPSSRYVSVAAAAAVLDLSRPAGKGRAKRPSALSISLSRHISLSGIVEQS